MGNFDFLLNNEEYKSFSKPCIEAESMIATSTVATAFMAAVPWSRLFIGFIVMIPI
ncbi:Type I restriction-modification system, restriction subunit R [Streptococcus mitis]|uniref:Type I restriction-modification system, restriction subunit R n=1 Tax=Streptococcus mitis TaxID=28037 RepID=A0A150NX66_STRMT|nr:Type I restriction-modification system, restriction subunit R [Streptococcus mitis]